MYALNSLPWLAYPRAAHSHTSLERESLTARLRWPVASCYGRDGPCPTEGDVPPQPGARHQDTDGGSDKRGRVRLKM